LLYYCYSHHQLPRPIFIIIIIIIIIIIKSTQGRVVNPLRDLVISLDLPVAIAITRVYQLAGLHHHHYYYSRGAGCHDDGGGDDRPTTTSSY
jgi:hypothetical protein